MESATASFRGPGPEELTSWGRGLQVGLRGAGPALFALAVFTLRSRVKT